MKISTHSLTPEELRKFPGLEGLSETEAQEASESLIEFAYLVHYLYIRLQYELKLCPNAVSEPFCKAND